MMGPRPGSPGYRPPSDGADRLLRRRKIVDGHWLFDGPLTDRGYALLHIGSRIDGTRTKISAHRLAYVLWVGPIPAGCDVHHTCEHRNCFRPDHLEAKPTSRHQRDHRAPNDLCMRGHRLDDPANVYIRPNGTRLCKACRRLRRRRNP